jgi:hypothetical protein
MGNLGIRLTWPLAWRTPQDQQRGPCAYRPDEPRQFLVGRAANPWRTLKLGFDVSQATVSRYMPSRTYPPRLRWRVFLHNQALGLGTIDFCNAGRISDQLINLVSWLERMARCSTKLRDSIFGGLLEPPWTLHLWRPSRTSIGTHHRAAHESIPVDPRRTFNGSATTNRRLSPYRSRAPPGLKVSVSAKSARSYSCRAYNRQHTLSNRLAPAFRTIADSRSKQEDTLITIRCSPSSANRAR